MKIRPATIADIDALLRLQPEVHDLHVQAEPHRYRQPPHGAVRARFTDLLDAEDTTILAAEGQHELLGYAVVTHERRPGHALCPPRRFILVDALSVCSKARRCGVGRRLMDAASARARALGCEGVELDVRAFNRDALAFYEALGFRTEMHRMSRPCATPHA